MSAGGSYVDALAQPLRDIRRMRGSRCTMMSDASSSGDNDDDISFSLFPQLYSDIDSSLAEQIITNADYDKLSLKLRGIKKMPGVSDKAATMPRIIRLAMLLRKISEMDSQSTRKQPCSDRQLTAGSGFISPPVGRTDTDRYKTELCRPYEETGLCKYGTKCQFAHGSHELRLLRRHPKYKTERCRTFHTTGFCPYGPRCHFVHHEVDLTMKAATPNVAQMAPRKKTHLLEFEDDQNVSGLVMAQCDEPAVSSARHGDLESMTQAMASLGLMNLPAEDIGYNCDVHSRQDELNERWCGSARLACPVGGMNVI